MNEKFLVYTAIQIRGGNTKIMDTVIWLICKVYLVCPQNTSVT